MKIHNLGFPRVGTQRELKNALESFWQGDSSVKDLQETARTVREKNWRYQSFLELVPIGDFSFYDQVLDMSFMLGNIPSRAKSTKGTVLDQYFRVARGQSAGDAEYNCIHAGEMTKWFDTNYHYIVPEFSFNTSFKLNPEHILEQLQEAQALEINPKPVIIGPVTYLWLGKEKDTINKYNLFQKLIPVYCKLLTILSEKGVEWIQIDEPILVTDLDDQVCGLLKQAYDEFRKINVQLILTSYFGELLDNLDLALSLPTSAIHIDAVRGKSEIERVLAKLPKDKILSLGVVDGRNIWKTNLRTVLDTLEPIAMNLGDRLWIAPSCSLLHVPVDLDQEIEMDSEIKSWLAFAVQKLEELNILVKAVKNGRKSVEAALKANTKAIKSRIDSMRIHNPKVKERLKTITPEMERRKSPYRIRTQVQREQLKLPLYPTTTIGSFPQTHKIRSIRQKFRKGEVSENEYRKSIQEEIKYTVKVQENLGLDVLVHGEPERNDMVEYFGEQLDGYIFSQFGWVQSYGSRCVKPPIIFGDVSRPKTMTVKWSVFAQSLTKKVVKGIVTGPVTILNWSFVRDDQPRSITCQQLALAIRDEVMDLEKVGIRIIQIDEPALREGLPLRKSQWKTYLDWTVRAFKVAANGVNDTTQIHTHMCYSEFNDIIKSIAEMDADVIMIETSRSGMELLNAFDEFHYPNEIGPGVYDIHSPNIPSVNSIVELIQKAAKQIPAQRLWVNPDCGLKTRTWPETKVALANMVKASHKLRT